MRKTAITIPAGLLDDLAMGTAMDVVDQAVEVFRISASGERSSVATHRSIQNLRRSKVYCYRVASVVGLVCIHIFGYRDPAAEALAEQCGLAFQLTNIIRDVKEDAAMGRVYLPEEDLAKFDLTAADLLAAPDAARFRPLLKLEADRAREGYQAGDQLIPYISEAASPRSSCWSISIASCWKKSPNASMTYSVGKSA